MIFFKKTISGFTLIETLISVLLTAVICSTLMLGITHSKMYLGSIRVKEKALMELRNWTNEWKSLIASGQAVPSNFNENETVVLKRNSNGDPIVTGKMFSEITKANESGKYSVFYKIDTYLAWEHNNFFFKGTAADTLRFNTYQIQFQTN